MAFQLQSRCIIYAKEKLKRIKSKKCFGKILDQVSNLGQKPLNHATQVPKYAIADGLRLEDPLDQCYGQHHS